MAPDKSDEVVQFFTAHPDTFELLKSVHRGWLNDKDRAQASPCHDSATRCHAKLVRLIAESTFHFTDGTLDRSESANERLVLINHLQAKLPRDRPLPLVWPVGQGNSTPATMATTPDPVSTATGRNNDGGVQAMYNRHDWSYDGDSVNLTPSFIDRLAISRDSDFIYPPELVKMMPETAGTSAAPWWYGTLYVVEYPEHTTSHNNTTIAAAHEELARLGVSLPEMVIDLGRLVVTSDMEERSDGSSWSPSDFTVMVDIKSKAKTTWLVCDRDIANKLAILNSRDGLAEDLASVRRQFNPQKMDLALLFPSISNWTSCHNTWPELEGRISTTAMKLGLHIRHP